MNGMIKRKSSLPNMKRPSFKIKSPRARSRKKSKLTEKDVYFLQKCTQFTEAQINDWYQSFKIKDDLKMSKARFMELHEKFFSGKPEKYLDRIFEVFDSDSRGYLEFSEVLQCINFFSDIPKEEKVDWAFRLCDIDGNGSIDYSEMYQMMTMVCEILYSKSDPLLVGTKTKILFRQLDVKDGCITKEEFARAINNNDNDLSLIIDLPTQQITENISAQNVFGKPLDEQLYSTKREIAYPIELCVESLLHFGVREEGLFRKPGGQIEVLKLQRLLEAGIPSAAAMAEFRNPHVVASTLKTYLRELPEPLMTNSLYDEWMHVAMLPDTDLDAKLYAVRSVVEKLPKYYANNLRYMIKFLAQLAAHEQCNKMNPGNIAVVIAPNLIRDPNDDPTQLNSGGLEDMMKQNSLVKFLVGNSDWLFPGKSYHIEKVESHLRNPYTPGQTQAMDIDQG